MVLFGMSWVIIRLGPIHVFVPTFSPGMKETFIPVFVLSPKTMPNLRLLVSTFLSLMVILILPSSKRRFAVMVPAPMLQFSPIILSPMYDRCPMWV